jgi:hypothetical protein
MKVKKLRHKGNDEYPERLVENSKKPHVSDSKIKELIKWELEASEKK